MCLKFWVYKKNRLNFSLFKTFFELFFYLVFISRTSISIVTVMKNPDLLKFVPDHLKTKKMCKNKV